MLIFRHELAHILHGHLDFALEITGLGNMPASFTATGKMDHFTRLALEMDADSEAVSQAVVISSRTP